MTQLRSTMESKTTPMEREMANNDNVHFEAVLKSESGTSMFSAHIALGGETLKHIAPPAGLGAQAAILLQSLGFRIRHIGTFSISGECPKGLWETVFGTSVRQESSPMSTAHPELGSREYWAHVTGAPFTIPSELQGAVERAYPQPPPIFFESPLPPRVGYHHLRVPDDVATILRSNFVHKRGVTGKGVLVAMPDTGFYRHQFYVWHGYNYNRTLSPDATFVERDEFGHGTAEAANIFANAPDIDFIGVKMGANATLAFKTASDLHPYVMTNSWGYNLCGVAQLPNFLKPLEAAVVEAVRERGITVCFSAGNGHTGFPGMMPDVVSVGGVFAHDSLLGEEFKLEASNYASSFDSVIYPGRHVPDVCGLVGMIPRAIYIMLPVEPGDTIDGGLAGAAYPNKDETKADDGWAVISGTSAASPQIAGVCALLKQAQPGLSPAIVKAILKASARDVKLGQSNNTCGVVLPAGEGHDGATGAGLVDAKVAYELVRSVTPRPLFALPPPR